MKHKNSIYLGAKGKESLVDLEIPKNFNAQIVIFIHGFMGFPRLGNESLHAIASWIQQLGTKTVAKGLTTQQMSM